MKIALEPQHCNHMAPAGGYAGHRDVCHTHFVTSRHALSEALELLQLTPLIVNEMGSIKNEIDLRKDVEILQRVNIFLSEFGKEE